jgi:hypothetical protein
MKRLAWSVAALGFCTLSGCGSGGGGGDSAASPLANAPVKATISGVVVDKQNAPVAGATITVYSNNTNTVVTTTTNASGAYSVAGLDTGVFTSGQPSDYAVYAELPGAGFSPSVSDAAGAVRREDFNGYYRSVVRFIPMPARNVTGVNFTASKAGDKLADLPRTGQTISYASGDDAMAQRGVPWPARRFVDNGDGTVSDQLTGLIWLKDAGCLASANWATALTAANQLASGACGLTDGSKAGQWRMPNANELESLVDVEHANPALPAGNGFTGVKLAAAYWSSTTYTAQASNAMAIRFTDGRWINGAAVDGGGGFDNNKTTSVNAVWPVKSGAGGAIHVLATGAYSGPGGGGGLSFGQADDASLQLGVQFPSPRFVDKGDGTVADTVTGLIWLKKADCINQTWSAALATIQALASGQCGLNDGSKAGQWRMPNRAEMLSLSDRAPTFPQANYLNGIPGSDGQTVKNAAAFSSFKAFQYYWTSTTVFADPSQAWAVYSCDFGVYNRPKLDTQQFALAVR